MNISENRNSFLDFSKAIAIILVVVGHCIQYGSGTEYLASESFFLNPVFKFIYSFHMPLFMLISGYLFAYSANRRSLQENIQKKFSTLIIPILVWSTILFLGSIVKDLHHHRDIVSLLYLINKFILCILNQLWFLWAIFWSSLVILISRKYLKDSWIAYLLFIISSLFIPDKYNSHLYVFVFPYYLLGYKYNTCRSWTSLHSIWKNRIFILIIITIFIGLLLVYRYDSYVYSSGYYILNGNGLYQLYTNIYRFAIGLVGSCSVLIFIKYVTNMIKDKSLIRPILYIGQQTKGIYILQGYFNYYILVRLTTNFQGVNYLILIAESIAVILLCLCLLYFIKKNNIANLLLLGGK